MALLLPCDIDLEFNGHEIHFVLYLLLYVCTTQVIQSNEETLAIIADFFPFPHLIHKFSPISDLYLPASQASHCSKTFVGAYPTLHLQFFSDVLGNNETELLVQGLHDILPT